MRGQRHDHEADGDVDEQAPAPRQQVGEQAAEQHADAGAGRGGRAVHGDRACARGALGEGGRQQRERRRRGDRGADALQRAGAEQPRLRLREAAEQGGADEQAEPGDEDAAPAQQIAQARAQQQQATERQRVCVLHPGQPRGREPEIGVDLRKGGDDDRCVEHDHQLDREDDREDDGGVSGAAAKAGHCLAAP